MCGGTSLETIFYWWMYYETNRNWLQASRAVDIVASIEVFLGKVSQYCKGIAVYFPFTAISTCKDATYRSTRIGSA
jgi:hypothetical protein